MPQCPNCGAEIDELYYEEAETGHVIASIADGRLNFEYKKDDEDGDEDGDECYRCPCCDAVVAHDDDTAKEILLGL